MTQHQTRKKRNIRKSSGFENKETEGFFMIAKKSAAQVIVEKMTGNQCRLWLLLMMNHPFADISCDGEKIYRSIPSPQNLAIKIGASSETIVKDMRKLKNLQLYDYRTTAWQGYNQSAAHAKEESSRLKRKKVETVTRQNERLNKLSKGLNKPPEELNNPQRRLNNPSQKPETQTSRDINGSPQTYSDFIKSLSDEERGKYLDFAKEETRNFNRPINDIEAWLASKTRAGANRWEVYYQNYEDYRGNNFNENTQLDPKIAEFQKRI